MPADALIEARSIIGEDAKVGEIMLDQRIDVEDEFKNLVYSLEFSDAVAITYTHAQKQAGPPGLPSTA